MKVFIITEGGRHIGFGHMTRCISLYQAFEERGIIPQFIVNGDDVILDILKGKKYQIFNWLKEKNKLFKLVKNADVAIIDSYLADISFYETLSKLVKIPVYIDDAKRLDYSRGIVVNGSIYAEELNYPEKENLIHLLGTKYIPLRKEFWEVPEKEIKEKVESVMVTFGGNDARNLIPKILKFLKDNYPNLKKNAIVGKAFRNIDEIKGEVDKNTNLTYYPDAEKMKGIMLASDIAISAGGQTLYELARVGVPTLGVCVSENQEFNLKRFHKSSFLKFVGWYNDNNLDKKMIEMIEKFLIKEERRKTSSIGQKLVDGQGAKRIVNYISQLT